jgi:hypothetical protein
VMIQGVGFSPVFRAINNVMARAMLCNDEPCKNA